MRISDEHTFLIGKLAKITPMGVCLEKEYKLLFGFGNEYAAESLYWYCHHRDISLLFIDEKPEKRYGLTWFCLKEVGIEASGDWHWLTLDQLMICSI